MRKYIIGKYYISTGYVDLTQLFSQLIETMEIIVYHEINRLLSYLFMYILLSAMQMEPLFLPVAWISTIHFWL